MSKVFLFSAFSVWLFSLIALGVAQAAPGAKALPELTGRPAHAAGGASDRHARALEAEPAPAIRREGLPRPVRLEGGTLRYRFTGWEADLAMDGEVILRDRRASYRARRAEVEFEAGGGATGRRGGDPYAMEKLRFLDLTRDFRGQLRERARARWQAAFLAELPGRLLGLWSRKDLSPAEKRLLIYELWRECLEPGSPTWHVAAGRARALILAFVRRSLPQGSPQAFSPEELRRLGGQPQGVEAFAPYAGAKGTR
ncbi:MAG: hypothetical protein RBU30_03830 [Polyangia bacterium]|nr:hypothetical protein [Polyangia bacterium]